jgi:serine/threonine protein kinase
VAHRDINWRWGDKIDFGLATAYLSDQYNNMTDTVGTLYSMAPEGEQRYSLHIQDEH